MSLDAILSHTISHGSDINCISSFGSLLATCSVDKTVRLWNTDDYSENPVSPLLGHGYSVLYCAFSPFGTQLATCSIDGKVILWNTKTGEKSGVIEHQSRASIRVCRFSPDSSLLATGSDDDTIGIWEISTRKLTRVLKGHEESVISLAFSPDGIYLVSSSIKGDIKVWDGHFGHGICLFTELDGHDLGTTCIDFSPAYGQYPSGAKDATSYTIATCGNDDNLKLWTLTASPGTTKANLKLDHVFVGHDAQVIFCRFSSNGNLLASTSGDKTAKIWDPIQKICLYTVSGHSRFVTACTFFNDNKNLATSSNDRTVKIWSFEDEIDAEDLLIDVNDSAGAPLQDAAGGHWTVDDVCAWLEQIGLAQYQDNFRSNAIDGAELRTLTNDSLQNALHIEALGHRNKILRAIHQIKDHPVIQPKDETGIPDEFLCPITHEIMREPVMVSDGYTYEKSAITAWFRKGKNNSPMTNSPLPNMSIVPNRSLKMLIQKYVQTHS